MSGTVRWGKLQSSDCWNQRCQVQSDEANCNYLTAGIRDVWCSQLRQLPSSECWNQRCQLQSVETNCNHLTAGIRLESSCILAVNTQYDIVVRSKSCVDRNFHYTVKTRMILYYIRMDCDVVCVCVCVHVCVCVCVCVHVCVCVSVWVNKSSFNLLSLPVSDFEIRFFKLAPIFTCNALVQNIKVGPILC